ncbi:hypothetical protein PTTG_05849 [Puccinia triticina 1-1 BBBD Race 1]|uniref:Uncharacterized protein n=2 Tax=Puccinia triticina TaxID=208348 RepID=A0A0C4EYE9_PUCT1|nr:uncharacterized protein PtA15_6A398 [Puccinia triticina]OAV89598.1 hypothetical protein PTTG_05849 [Puccinia triticina 1-1 BBBD Race 1]WAQ85769.1 hypothetical protein PtA15_6A398 [Puccinia triticina]WAR55647.1 hypothetical protein PtB15_6B390 [Puccinia triticina]
MSSKHASKPGPSPSKTRSIHDQASHLEHAHPSSSNPDRWKTQRRKESFVAQIERIRENNLKRREGIYTKAWQELQETQNALMSNPPTEINYLVRLHRESLKREQELVAVQVYHDHLISATRAAFDAEVRSIEEEFTNARTQAKEKLLESLEERRKKLKDEKELIDFNEEAVGHSHRAHTTRGLRNRSSNRTSFPRGSPALGTSYPTTANRLEGTFNNPDHHLSADPDLGSSTAGLPPSGSYITADDPFSMATLNVDPHLRQSPIFQQLLQLGTHTGSRRGGPGGPAGSRRAPTGLPGAISLPSITPGTWNNFHKSQLGICSAKNDDTDADVDQIRSLAGLLSPKKRRMNNLSNLNQSTANQNSTALKSKK